MEGLHPDSHAHAKVTLGWGRSQGAVGGEDTVVHKPCGSVELGEEGLDAPAVAVLRVGNGLKDGGANDGLGEEVSGVHNDHNVAKSDLR